MEVLGEPDTRGVFGVVTQWTPGPHLSGDFEGL